MAKDRLPAPKPPQLHLAKDIGQAGLLLLTIASLKQQSHHQTLDGGMKQGIIMEVVQAALCT
jgi:hypothetical protein